MTSRSDSPFIDTDLTPELIPLATELEAEIHEYPVLERTGEEPMEALMDAVPEAALPEEIEALPGDVLEAGETSAEGELTTTSDDDLDEDAAARALEAADIDLTGIDPAVLSAESYVGESAEIGIDDTEIETLVDVQDEELLEEKEEPGMLDVEVPLMSMGFGDPGIPVPEGFDPISFVTDPEKINEMREEAAFLDVENALDFAEIAVMDSEPEGAPSWPFDMDEIPEVR